MIISDKLWKKYISDLRLINDEASNKMAAFLQSINNWKDSDAKNLLIDYAYGLTTKYGEAAAEISCEMYDKLANAEAVNYEPAEPAETANIHEVAKAVNGTLKTGNVEMVASAVGRMVKMAGVDTTMHNAIRDNAEWAWVPSGDTCAYCIALASRGWQPATVNALKDGHAEHIHANCDCTYAIRFNDESDVEGYDPDYYLDIYKDAEGNNSQEKINAIRRKEYAANKEKIQEQKRIAAEKRSNKELVIPLEFEYNKTNSFIPQETLISEIKTIAGGETDKTIKIADDLSRDYGGSLDGWRKKAGKIDNDRFILDIHWYEYDGTMYDPKIKFMKEK